MTRSCMPSFWMIISSKSPSYLSLKTTGKTFQILKNLFFHRLSCLKKSYKKNRRFWKLNKEETIILKCNFKSLKEKEFKILKSIQLVENSEMKQAKVKKKMKHLIKEKCKDIIYLKKISLTSQNKPKILRISKIKIRAQRIYKKTRRNGIIKEMENLKTREKKINISKIAKGLL